MDTSWDTHILDSMHNIENIHVLHTHCHNYSYSVRTIQMSTYYFLLTGRNIIHAIDEIIQPLHIQMVKQIFTFTIHVV